MDGSLLSALKSSRGERREENCIMRLVESYVKNLSLRKKPAKSLSQQLRESVRRLA
jgi:hypothetical protein